VAIAAACCFAVFAAGARADDPTVVDDPAGPWAGGAELVTPLEALLGTAGSSIAGRSVSVRCEDDAGWEDLASQHGFAPTSVLGFVSFFRRGPVDYAEISPDVCRSLQSFAAAELKPTKCVASTPKVSTRTVREKVVKTANGRQVVTWRSRTIRKTTYIESTGPAGPCFVDGKQLSRSQPFWSAYFYTAQAIQTLAHESIHLKGNANEAEAECYGMQSLAYTAMQLGDTADDAASIAEYYATQLYPQRQSQSPAYWSADCREDGPLDLTPGDGVWP
jgi:hypothetical protein